jgi:hypothetical protein
MTRRLALVFSFALFGASPAWAAQAEGEPGPPPPAPPAAATPPPAAAAENKLNSAGTDHGEVLGAVGLQVQAVTQVPGGAAADQLVTLGVRYWMNDKMAIEGGMGLLITHVSPSMGDGTTGFGFGLAGGIPLALGVYKHITTFFEPALTFAIFGGSGADTSIDLNLSGNLGFEWQLGYVDASRLSVIYRMGLGLDLATNAGVGKATIVNFATTGGNSIEGLFQSTVAVCFYL